MKYNRATGTSNVRDSYADRAWYFSLKPRRQQQIRAGLALLPLPHPPSRSVLGGGRYRLRRISSEMKDARVSAGERVSGGEIGQRTNERRLCCRRLQRPKTRMKAHAEICKATSLLNVPPEHTLLNSSQNSK